VTPAPAHRGCAGEPPQQADWSRLSDWWQDGYDLKQRYYTSPLDHPDELVELSGDAVGCVWELEVLLHERAAWIDHVLNSEADDFQAYLQDVFPRFDLEK
jgi:hypothetical protein